jgi:hypothetical protein
LSPSTLHIIYAIGLSLVVAGVLLGGLAVARRASSLWIRGAVLLLTIVVAFRLAFVIVTWADLRGYEGWILALGSVVAAGWHWYRARRMTA